MSDEFYTGSLYLVCESTYRRTLRFRTTSKAPGIRANEIAIKIDVKLPAALFTRPSLRATVSVPESSAPGPTIDSVVVDNIREILRQQLGADITLAVIEPTKEVQS